MDSNRKPRVPRTPREKYGEELRLRRMAAELTQEALGEQVVCSPTLISHFEAGRRLPNPDDAQRIDRALGTDGFFARWLEDLETKYADHFAAVAELEQQAKLIQQFAPVAGARPAADGGLRPCAVPRVPAQPPAGGT